jgi:hypothetical protein
MGEHPVAGADVPTGVAIAEQPLHAVKPGEEKDDGHQEGDVRQGRQQVDDRVLFGLYQFRFPVFVIALLH